MQVFSGEHQAATLSFRPGMDCEEAAEYLAQRDVAVRAGLHCAPLAHQSAGTETTGTVRVSFSDHNTPREVEGFLDAMEEILTQKP